MTSGTFLLVLFAFCVVMGIWGVVKRTGDAERYRQAPPDLSGFSQTIDPAGPGESR